MARPVLFDTDIGSDVDDALALGLILAEPEALELVAVTTVARDTALRGRIALGLLALGGRADVEVCAGERQPLAGAPDRFGWFGHEPDCVVASDARVSDEPAPERIVRAAREHEGLEILLVGPMTNMARALALDPELRRRVGGLTIMGGHVREVRIGEHVCAPGIDYNLCSDPAASVAVLGSGCPITLVTADVTLQTWLSQDELPGIEASGPLGRELVRQVRTWEPVQRRIFTGLGGSVAADNAAFLHDPLTVLSCVDPAPLHFEQLRVVPTIERGVLRTLEAPPDAELGSQMRVATRVDAAAAARAICQRLARP